MEKYYSRIRAGKTVRERLDILLELHPCSVFTIATSGGAIETQEDRDEYKATGTLRPIVYDHQSMNEVKEFFAAYLEIFMADREKAPEERRAEQESRYHAIINRLEARFTLFESKAESSNNSELATVKAIAKGDLDDRLIAELYSYEQDWKSIGVNAFHSVPCNPKTIAEYIIDKLEELRQQEKRKSKEGKLTPVQRALKELDPYQPTFFHRRFFPAFVGYKCEELKRAIENYKPQADVETSSLVQVPEEWPLREEFFTWFRNNEQSVNCFLLACHATKFDPFAKAKGYLKNNVESLLKELTGRSSWSGFKSKRSYIGCSIADNEKSKVSTLSDLGEILSTSIEGETVRSLLQKLETAPISDEGRARIDSILRLLDK